MNLKLKPIVCSWNKKLLVKAATEKTQRKTQRFYDEKNSRTDK